MSDIKELLTELDFEQWLDTEGIIYRRGGVSARGREINIKECPVCGSSGWKVYFNLTNNVGKCFAGDHPIQQAGVPEALQRQVTPCI